MTPTLIQYAKLEGLYTCACYHCVLN